MLGSRRHLGLAAAIFALVAIAMFAPRFHLPHTTPKWRAVQTTDLNYNRWFAVDTQVDRDTPLSQQGYSPFVEIALTFAHRSVQSNDYSRPPIPQERRLLRPLRRLPSSADSEEPTA
jgi:hypothetical protein